MTLAHRPLARALTTFAALGLACAPSRSARRVPPEERASKGSRNPLEVAGRSLTLSSEWQPFTFSDDEAGLRAGDLLVKLGGAAIASLEDLALALRTHRAGDVVEVEWKRGGATLRASVTLGERRRE